VKRSAFNSQVFKRVLELERNFVPHHRLAHFVGEEIRLVERANECAIQFVWLLAHEKEPPLLVDVCFAWIVSIGHRGTGRPLNPKRVELQRAPAHREMYEAHFHSPVKFKASQNALVFSKADMDLAFVSYNAELLAIVAPQLEAELTQQLAQKTFREQAKAILKRLLAGQRPGIQDVARELHLSTRTLQRRLTEQGITFQRLLEQARRELTHHYLLHSVFCPFVGCLAASRTDPPTLVLRHGSTASIRRSSSGWPELIPRSRASLSSGAIGRGRKTRKPGSNPTDLFAN
jgi:hypothetical protein